MVIAGMQKTSLIDFPGKIAATLFMRGCNFRCGYCHNSELVLPECFDDSRLISSLEALDFLRRRVGKLDGVCISGGEPTIHRDLPNFLREIKKLGYAIKLDTNGTFPEVVENILSQGSVDYIAMDIKAPLDGYRKVAGVVLPFDKFIKRSVQLIMHSGYPYEFRTTLIKPLLSVASFEAMGLLVAGASQYYLQPYKKSKKQLDASLDLETFQDQEIDAAVQILQKFVKNVTVRGR